MTYMNVENVPNDLSRELEIGKKLYLVVTAAATDENGVHAETAIASASHMAGMFLLLSFNFNLEEMKVGQVVLSENANERGPELLQILSRVLSATNVKINTDDLGKDIPEDNKPHLSVLESEKRLSVLFTEVANELSADNETMARAAAIAAGMLITDTQAVLDSTLGFSIAAYGFIEGAKTVPFKLA